MSIDTACSSALVGTHMGVQHLAAVGGKALAAGVNLMLAERTTAATQVRPQTQHLKSGLTTQHARPLSAERQALHAMQPEAV